MSAPAAEVSNERELQQLYGRYKALALATGATLLLDASPDELETQAAELLEDCRRAAVSTDAEYATQHEACTTAARELHGLLLLACEDRGLIGPDEIAPIRATHSALRREVWKVFPCEYVPCSGAHRHSPPHDR